VSGRLPPRHALCLPPALRIITVITGRAQKEKIVLTGRKRVAKWHIVTLVVKEFDPKMATIFFFPQEDVVKAAQDRK